MNDPLKGFDWASLHTRYDAICHGFDPSVAHLAAFTLRPQSDRELYYRLLDTVRAEPGKKPQVSIGLYEAMLYWKLYSNPLSRGNLGPRGKVGQWFVPATRETVSHALNGLVKSLPHSIGRDIDQLVHVIAQVGEHSVIGMKSETALPVRTTFLHFLFPDVVPIFDEKVLQAVGINNRDANKDMAILKQYVPFAWHLADRHSARFAGLCETPVRSIDMALWVSRGGC